MKTAHSFFALRCALVGFIISMALLSVVLITPRSVHAAVSSKEPKWALPFRNYTSVKIGDKRLHGDNFSSIQDDTKGYVYTFPNYKTQLTASMDLVLEPEFTTFDTTSHVPAVALAKGTVLAVWQYCHVVLIDYGSGWWAIYLHMNNIQVTYGQSVNTNTNIGYPMTINRTTSTCGMEYSDVYHVHFAFIKQDTTKTRTGNYVSMTGQVLCGYTVTSTGHLNGLADPYFVVPNCQSPDIAGSNLWVTGHDGDYHCTLASLSTPDDTSWMSNQCHYLQVAINFSTRGPYRGLSILVLDHSTQLATAINNAFGPACETINGVQKCAAPKIKKDDPRTQFASEPLLDTKGKPLFSAIIVASDITCGGCDNNNAVGDTPDSNAINARSSDIKKFYNAGGGILALAGAQNSNVFYNFVPIPTIASSNVNTPFGLTAVGLSLGLIEGSTVSDDNCCPTHNTFAIPGSLSLFQIAENDNAGSGFPETLIVKAGFAM